MEKKNRNSIIVFSAIFYIITFGLMIFASIGNNDLELNKILFNPQSRFSIGLEAFGQFVYWGMWGPIFSVLFVTRHGLNECLEIIGRILPFIKPIGNTESKIYKALNIILKGFFAVLFFVLADIGYKKLIENVLKQFFDISQIAYFIICAVVSLIAILVLSRVDRKKLNKLESLALAGIVMGILCKIVENCKEITGRVRFREMVAWDNGITELNSNGEIVSNGEPEKLKAILDKSMIDKTDFSAFSKWYEKGKDTGVYHHSNSFPSGHTTYSATMFLTVLFCNAFDKLKKLAPFALIISFVYVALMGYSRIIAGAHYLSDVVGGALIGYTIFLIATSLYSLFNKKGILPTRSI